MKSKAEQLIIQDFSIGYSPQYVLVKEINFSVSAGLTGVIGLNGCGKSTFLKSLAGILPALNGEVKFNQFSLSEANPNAQRARIMSVVLTEKQSLPFFTVFDSVSIGRSPHTDLLGTMKEKDLLMVNHAMESCGISFLRDKYFDELSDGQKQKCRIARAIAQDTPVVLLDEPTTYLDFKARFEIMTLLNKLANEKQKIILFSSHDLNMVFRYTDQCLVFNGSGKVQLVTKNEYLSSSCISDLMGEFSLSDLSFISSGGAETF